MICRWLETATEQEVFDKAYLGLMAQGQPSTKEYGGCYYRSGENGELKCAAGFLIPDEEYDPKIEEYWTALVNGGKVPPAHDWLIAKMQGIHDNAATDMENHEDFKNKIKEGFESLAREKGLTIPQLQGAE